MHLGLTAGFGDGEFDDAVGVGDLGAEAGASRMPAFLLISTHHITDE
jgi:hypothetical protein